MKTLAKLFVVLLAVIAALLVAAYLASPIEPVAFQTDDAASLSGPYAGNDRLADARRLALGSGPEDVILGPDGRLYTGLLDGRIVSFTAAGDVHEFTDTGGRPLGLAFDADGDLLVADADRGLLTIARDGQIEVLVDSFNGERLRFVDDLDIADDGVIWFSDASQRFGVHNYMYDFLEASRTGRLFRYDPASRQTMLAIDGLYFANGVALGPDDAFVLVTETGAGKIHRLWLKGAMAGERDIFAAQLPGNPDNLSFNGSDIFWVAMPALRGSAVEQLDDKPLLRRLLASLPAAWLVPPERRAFVVGLSLDGEPLANLQWRDGELHTITSANQFGDTLYLGSIDTGVVGIYALDEAAD